MNSELPDVQAGFRKGRGTRGQIANIHWIIEKAKEFQKNIYFCFIDYAKAFDCVDHNKLENSLRDGNTRPPDLPLEKPVCRQEATVRTGHGTTDWFQTGKGVCQGCILSPCLALCDPMDCSTPGLPVHHQLLELLKLMSVELVVSSNHHILCPSPSPPAFNLSQHQGLFK